MNKASQFKTSVVVVTKDRPESLTNLLRSLTLQSLKADEVIVVNNNSSRSYDTIFSQFQNQLPLRVVLEKTPGISIARNRGIREATGDILLFTDDDCQADPYWIENMVKPFYRNPYIGAVGGEILSVKKIGTLVEEFCVLETLMRMGCREEEKI
jgi:glycosyltransferase involved in cell wall biosynthesis